MGGGLKNRMTSESRFSLAFITTTNIVVIVVLLHLKEFKVLYSFFVFLQTKLFEINN